MEPLDSARRLRPPRPLSRAMVFAAASVFAFLSLPAELIHRYNFEGEQGPAVAGTPIVDLVGGADGVIVGNGAMFTGAGILELPGGGGGSTAAYVDLPNGLLSAHDSVTFEAWFTIYGPQAWGRIWDFGSSEPGEVLGSGGGGQGQDYFMYTPFRGTDFNLQRYTVRNLDPVAPGGTAGPVDNVEEPLDTALPTSLFQQYHVVGVWAHDGGTGGTLTTYRDGENQGSSATTFYARDINDVNNWLGRSNWTGDSYFQGSFNEFRIHDVAFDDEMAAASFAAGPNNPPGAQDFDNDGMPDDYENQHPFLDPTNPADADLDEDMDGLSNKEEFVAGTRPDVEDTDGDGLEDGEEVNTHLTNPLLADSDGDNLPDGDEVNTHFTHPLLPDTDGDGLRDGIELYNMLPFLDPAATTPTALHRWSFNNPVGSAPSGTLVEDSIGGANGTVLGADGAFTGTGISLPGGPGGTAAYIDLPNGLLSAHETVTFEAWFSVNLPHNWSRLWDFGSTEGGEITGVGGGGAGQDYFAYAPMRGEDPNLQRNLTRNLDPAAPGGGTGPVDGDEEGINTGLLTNFDQIYHVAGVWASDLNGGGQLVLYRDGVRVGSTPTTYNATDINDVNNWLGRSNWTPDGHLQGTIDEFRIYEGAMNDAAAAASFAAGPEAGVTGTQFLITVIDYDTQTGDILLVANALPSSDLYCVEIHLDELGWIGFDDNVSVDQNAGTITWMTNRATLDTFLQAIVSRDAHLLLFRIIAGSCP